MSTYVLTYACTYVQYEGLQEKNKKFQTGGVDRTRMTLSFAARLSDLFTEARHRVFFKVKEILSNIGS